MQQFILLLLFTTLTVCVSSGPILNNKIDVERSAIVIFNHGTGQFNYDLDLGVYSDNKTILELISQGYSLPGAVLTATGHGGGGLKNANMLVGQYYFQIPSLSYFYNKFCYTIIETVRDYSVIRMSFDYLAC